MSSRSLTRCAKFRATRACKSIAAFFAIRPQLTFPSVEITSPHAGKVAKLNADVGKVIKVGMTLCELETDAVDEAEAEAEAAPEPEAATPPPPPPRRREAAPPTPAPAPPSPPAAAAPPKRAPRPHPLDDTAVRFEGEASVLPQAPKRQMKIPDSVEARREGGGQVKRIVKASPAVRALAGRLGVELEDATPTGDGGRVTREDLERLAAEGSAASSSSAPAPTPSASAPRPAAAPRQSSAAPVDRGENVERMEMGRTRKVMYKAMGSMGSVPHFG